MGHIRACFDMRITRLLLMPLALLAPLAMAGCQANKPEQPAALAAPNVQTHIDYYNGTPLSGPRATAVTLGTPTDTLAVKLQLFAWDHLPAEQMQLVGGAARLIIATRGADPVLPSSQITQGSLIASGDVATKLIGELDVASNPHSAKIASFDGIVAGGATTVFDAAEGEGPSAPRRTIELRVFREQKPAPADGLQVAITIEDQPGTAPKTASTQPSPSRSETALFDRPLQGGADQLVLLLPLQLNGSPANVFVAALSVFPGSNDAGHVKAVADAQKTLNDSAAAIAKKPQVGPIEGSEWAGLESALSAITQPGSRRAALAYLAGQTQAHICLDTTLAADDSTLDTLSQAITKRVADPALPHTTAALSWALDLSAFELLATARMNQTGPHLAPELVAVLTLYGGEAGRHGSTLEEIVRHLSSRQDLENHLIAENMVYLTDSSPSARVRAFDWLRSRSLAPAGFDPLGPIKQRREALDRASGG